MADETGTGEAACGICGGGTLEEMLDYRSLQRVTSDCRSWPAGGRLGVCRVCGAVQKPADDAFLTDIEAIYRSYTIYHQAAGAEQAVFEQVSGLPASRSVKLLDTFRRYVGLNATGRMLDVGCGNGATIRAFGQVAPGIVDPVAVLATLRGKLTPGGLLLIEVPHHPANPFELLIADHRSHFTADSLSRALTAAGCEIMSVAENWIPKELSVVARPAVAQRPAAPGGEPVAARNRIAGSIAWLRRTADRLRELADTGSVGLFGTSIAGTWLAAEAGDRIGFFVDEDPNRSGRSYLGRPVLSPATVAAGSRVFVGLPPAVAAGICGRLATPGVAYLAPPA